MERDYLTKSHENYLSRSSGGLLARSSELMVNSLARSSELVVNSLSKSSNLDVFPKEPDDIKVKTTSSGLVTIVVGVLMAFLMISELIRYRTVEVTSEVGVDTSFGSKLPINVDIVMPNLPCKDFGLDFMDHAGEQQLEVEDGLWKADVGNGCRIWGYLLTNKVAGEFHIAFGRLAVAVEDAHGKAGGGHIHRFTMNELRTFDPSHIIQKLSFGEDIPGIKNPLDDTRHIVTEGSAQFQYYIKVVPTTYYRLDGTVTNTNQYSFTLQQIYVNTRASSFKQPGAYFKYDLAPYRVTYREHRQLFSHFLTQLCAILGGLFGVAGMISSGIFGVSRAVKKRR